MKILWLASWYPNRVDAWNGDFIQRHAVAAALYHEVHVVHVGDYQAVRATDARIHRQGRLTEEVILYPSSRIPLLGRWINNYRFARLYRQAIRCYIQKNGTPDLVHVQVPMKAGLAALWCRRRYGVPYLVTEHYTIYNEQAPDRFRRRSPWFQYYTRKIIERSVAFLPVSRELGEAVNRYGIRKPFRVLPNVVDTGLFHPAEHPGTPAFVFLHVSIMVDFKNVPGILRAFCRLHAAYPHINLRLVGPVPDDIAALARATGLLDTAIFFTGAVPYAAVAEQMQQADAFVLFSRYENAPCVISEALCCGVPVIASRVGGIAEMIEPGKNGLLVEPDDEAALYESMQQALQASFNRQRIAAEAQQRYSYPEVGRLLSRYYQEVLQLAGPQPVTAQTATP
jgi:glycosyltransferase involved in cell wall biosynthesis